MITILFKIKDFVFKYWKQISLLLLLPILYGFFKKGTRSVFSKFTEEFNEQITQHGRTTTFTAGQLYEKSKRLAEALGTHKDGGSNSEDEDSAIEIVLTCDVSTDDYFFLESAYKHYQTELRNLSTDLYNYLSGGQYDSILYIINS